jgi:hypothetical protein
VAVALASGGELNHLIVILTISRYHLL